MTPQENSELIKHYLRVLKLRKEEYIRNYQPTDWELLTKEEQIILAAYHAHIRDEEDLETLLLIGRYNRENKERKRLSDNARYLAKSKRTSSSNLQFRPQTNDETLCSVFEHCL